MNLLGAPLSLVGGAFAAGGAALVALYVLKLRRRRVEVPFAHLWRRVVRNTESTALWKKLRRLISLLVQLTVLALLLFAIGDPRLAAGTRGRTVVIVVDASASMQSTDAKPTRMEAAKEEARKLVRGLGGDDTAMLVRMDARPAPVSGFQSDDRELLREIDSLDASDAPADLERALRLAADALAGRPRPELVLIGDGAWDDSVLARVHLKAATKPDLSLIDLSGIDLRYLPIGNSGENAGLTAFAVRRYRANQTAYEVLVEVQSFAKTAMTRSLELRQDGEVVEVEPLKLAPGERVQRRYPNLAGEGTRLEARLGGAHDVLPLDDTAYALLPPKKKLKVLLVTGGNLFLEGALLLDENLDITKVAPAAYRNADSAKYDAVVLDGFTPDEPPTTNALYVDPRGEHSPFAVRGEISAPLVTEVAANHPLMRWVTLKDLNISRASKLALEPGDVAVASALRDPIIAAREKDGRKVAALGFELRKSDLPLRVAFPVLVVNALEWFGGNDGSLVASYSTAHPWRLPAPPGAAELTVRGPGITAKAPVHDGRATFFGMRAGYYETEPGTRVFAANLASPSESRVEPRATLTVDGQTLRAPEPGKVGVRRALWAWLAAAALLLLFVEWWTYNRRVTV
jgi:von Willebrand factor type A domain/Aerotolerance regulator N-terminal